MISSTKVFEFVRLLKQATMVSGRSPEVSMMKPQVNECGTVGCHAGWAFIALGGTIDGYVSYTDGVRLMNQFFGIEYDEYTDPIDPLRNWAASNPEIWGNDRGYGMFTCGTAFGQDSDDFDVSVIIAHWRGVGERLLAREGLDIVV